MIIVDLLDFVGNFFVAFAVILVGVIGTVSLSLSYTANVSVVLVTDSVLYFIVPAVSFTFLS